MENFIVKFKNELKKLQSARKKVLKECEQELAIIRKLLDEDPRVFQEVNSSTIDKKLFIATTLGALDITIMDIKNKNKGKRKQKKAVQETIQIVYDHLLRFIEHQKRDYTTTQNIINAFENDKIKDPINNIETLFNQISYTTLTLEEASRIIGMAISFNSQYAKRNKNHRIQNIDAIHQLANDYYNKDGSFKYHIDMRTFERRIKELFEDNFVSFEIINKILNFKRIYTVDDLIAFRFENNHKYRHEQNIDTKDIEDLPKNESYAISPQTRKALQELKKYYKNGTIIQIPENFEEFYTILKQCELDENEQKYIINLINEQISNQSTLTILKYLDDNGQIIYQRAITLLNSFSYSNGDVYALKQYIEELQTISHMLEIENDEENRQYLLSDVPNILEQLSLICDRYTIENNESTNKFIFLLNKNGIPYIYDDIDKLEQIYQKAIYSLITKIDKSNQSQFRKIISNEPLAYNMYEVINTRAHIAFVEVDAGIYVIIGADIPRNGYKELNNRLKANQLVIKQIENAVKNQGTRNEILKSNEEYLSSFTETNNPHLTKKLEIQNS